MEAQTLLDRYGAARLHDPDLYREFFARLFAVVPMDQAGVQALRGALNYPAVAKRYRLIDQETVAVVVPYGDGKQRLAAWRQGPSQIAWQRLQPFTVGIYRWEMERHIGGLLEPVNEVEDLYLWRGDYEDCLGLAAILDDPSDLG